MKIMQSEKQCHKVYKESANNGEWVQDDLKHQEIILCNDEITIKVCKYCGGKIYPDPSKHYS